jgi:hypothetical protein
MTCPVCGQRRARRACPALGQQICAVCCGTKRLVEIRCPDTCAYLATARQHPPAAIQRQQARDIDALQPTLRGLTETQQQIGFLLLSVISRYGGVETLDRLIDADVSDAAGALASTYETAAKGVIYEHRAPSLTAGRLVTGFRELIDHLSREVQARHIERDASVALRSIERGAREVQRLSGEPRSYVDLVQRMVRPYEAPERASSDPAAGSGLILPGA